MSFLSSIVSFVSAASPYVKDVASTGKDIYSAYSTYESYKSAEEQADVQREELERSRMLSEAAARKEARVKQARLLASGITSSTTSLGVVGLQSSLSSGLTNLSERTAYNVDTLGYQERAAKDQAMLSGVGSVYSAAAGTKEFTDLLSDNIDATGDLFDVPDGSFEGRG